MTVQMNNPIPKIRNFIPPQSPKLVPTLVLGMPPLPLTTKEPFTQAKMKPEGGAYATPVNIRGASVGGNLSIKSKKGTNGNRRRRSKVNQLNIGVKTDNTKAQKTKKAKGNNRKLLRGNGGKFVKRGSK